MPNHKLPISRQMDITHKYLGKLKLRDGRPCNMLTVLKHGRRYDHLPKAVNSPERHGSKYENAAQSIKTHG